MRIEAALRMVLWFFVSALVGPVAQAGITAYFMPHGDADPANPAWNPEPADTAKDHYRDIPWWFHDDVTEGNTPPGAADAYDVSAIFAARLNRDNSGGYEAALINTPNFTHLEPDSNPYGPAGGAFGTVANITWGNNVTWDFSFAYNWNGGAPTASMTFNNGTTTATASAALGSRIIDFVNGTGPYLETHILSDILIRVATLGTYSATPSFTMTSVTVADLAVTVGSGTAQPVSYYDENNVQQTALTTRWDYVGGATDVTNPRQVEFLVLDDALAGHTNDATISGKLTFAWTGSASAISQSGVMFEVKLGDLDLFEGAAPEVVTPEPTAFGLVLSAAALYGFRRRRRVVGVR